MEFIELGGDTRPIKFGFKVVKKFLAKYKYKKWSDFPVLASVLEVEDLPAFVHGALSNGAKGSGEEFKHTVQDVEEWLDDNPKPLLENIWVIYMYDLAPANKRKEIDKALSDSGIVTPPVEAEAEAETADMGN